MLNRIFLLIQKLGWGLFYPQAQYRVTSFIQKVCLQRRQLGLKECLFYKVVQRQNQGMVADFILRLDAYICCLHAENNY